MVRSDAASRGGSGFAAGSRARGGEPASPCISALAQVLMARTSDKAILDGLENIEVT